QVTVPEEVRGEREHRLEAGGASTGDQEELARKLNAVDAQAVDLDKQRQELATMRQELADIRRQLYERYQERRDRLAGLQAAVDRAARKVQERKRQLDTEEEKCRQRRQQEALQRADVDKRAAIGEEQKSRLEEERRRL